MSLTALGTHLDTLYLSIYCELPQKRKDLFEGARLEAQEEESDKRELCEVPGLPGGMWYMRPYGRGERFRYVMENASFYVAICAYETTKFPRIDFQFKAETLYEYGTQSYAELVRRYVRAFFGLLDYEVKVSRADVAVDFQLEGFECPQMADVVTRARKWQAHGDYGLQNGLILGRGKKHGALEAKIYNKSLEIEGSDKAWMFQIWKAAGGYSDQLPVWRAEVTLYRQGLAAFEVNTLEDFIGSMGDLLGYAIGEGAGGWLRVCDPSTRHHKDHKHEARRESADWWGELREQFLKKAAKTGRKRKGHDPNPTIVRNIELAGAHMVRAAALARLHTGHQLPRNPEAWGREVGRMYAELLSGKGKSWAEKLNTAMDDLKAVTWRAKVGLDDAAVFGQDPPELTQEYVEARDEKIRTAALRAEKPVRKLSGLEKEKIKTDNALAREDRSPVPSSSTRKLIQVRPSIKHEAGFYVSQGERSISRRG